MKRSHDIGETCLIIKRVIAVIRTANLTNRRISLNVASRITVEGVLKPLANENQNMVTGGSRDLGNPLLTWVGINHNGEQELN
jgi:hypothetical protein